MHSSTIALIVVVLLYTHGGVRCTAVPPAWLGISLVLTRRNKAEQPGILPYCLNQRHDVCFLSYTIQIHLKHSYDFMTCIITLVISLVLTLHPPHSLPKAFVPSLSVPLPLGKCAHVALC